jgi:hypothetical protein
LWTLEGREPGRTQKNGSHARSFGDFMSPRTHENPIVRVLASLKLTLTLLAVCAVAIATATFLEVRYGTDGARALVYNARWFEALLALLVVNLIVALLANMPYRRHQTGYVITHTAFIVVLVGAGITRFFGYEGTMPIREGSSTDYLLSSRDYIQLSSGDKSAAFPVRLYKTGSNHVHHTLSIDEQRFRVSVLEYWPHVESHITEGPGGKPALVFSSGSAAGARQILEQGDTLDDEGVTVHLVAELPESVEAGSVRGDLVINADGTTGRLAVPATPPAETTVNGVRVQITEFAPNFKVGQKPSASDPMINPAIRVKITEPGGATHERLLFAFHPDFNMGHAGGAEQPDNIDLQYRYGRNLYLFPDSAGGLEGSADFALGLASMEAARSETPLEAGHKFSVPTGAILRSGAFSFVPIEYWKSAVESPVLSTDTRQPAAAKVAVEDDAGDRAEALVFKYGRGSDIMLGWRNMSVSYGPIRIQLPYRLYLDDFVLITYPGSENPASFESHVRIYDEARGVDGEPARIYMNHPLNYRGFKHFQSSYDRDRLGTILTVNHDPGKWPTYIGYFFVGLGFMITLTRGILWYRKP